MAQQQSIKALLRQLYYRVHPDRFLGRPHAQEDNLRSFQCLQSLLQRTDGSGGAEEQIRFHLFPDDGDSAQEALQVVECRLRPSSLDGDLRHLLRLCGLQPGPSASPPRVSSAAPIFPFGSAKAAARARSSAQSMPSWWALRQPKVLSRESSFAAFVGKHASEQRVALAESERQGAEVRRLLHELRRSFGVRVELRDRWIPSLCARTLSDLREQLLESTLEQRRVLSGARVVVSANADVGGGSADRWGTLLLPAQLIHRKALLELAGRLDAREVEQGRARAAAAAALEAAAADALGLRGLRAADSELRAHGSYTAFLERLALEGRGSATSRAHLGAWARAACSDALMSARMPADGTIDLAGAAAGAGRGAEGDASPPPSLWRAVVEPSRALEETHALRAHNSRRLVHLPMHASPHAVAQHLGICGAHAATQMAMQGEALSAARAHVGAKRLSADESLSHGQVMAACARLGRLEPRAAARRLCAGLSLHLALSFSAEESGKLKVRWDFAD